MNYKQTSLIHTYIFCFLFIPKFKQFQIVAFYQLFIQLSRIGMAGKNSTPGFVNHGSEK